MLIEAGFDIAFQCSVATPMLLQLNIHPSREGDLETPDTIVTDPAVLKRDYIDLFGNRVTRLVAPPGLITFHNRFKIRDSGKPEATPPDTPWTPIAQLPNEVLMYLVSSRYCDTDKLLDFAWQRFGKLEGGYQRVKAILDFVQGKIRFSYPDARPTRCASDSLTEGVGVCRDFAHLAIALCRAMNIPARYCTGYLGDIGAPPDGFPMDFSGWAEAFIDGQWYTIDARHNTPRIGRIVMGRGRDAADVPLSTAFGGALLKRFEIFTDEVIPAGGKSQAQPEAKPAAAPTPVAPPAAPSA